VVSPAAAEINSAQPSGLNETPDGFFVHLGFLGGLFLCQKHILTSCSTGVSMLFRRDGGDAHRSEAGTMAIHNSGKHYFRKGQ
jgi:hypothetical protein